MRMPLSEIDVSLREGSYASPFEWKYYGTNHFT